MRKPETKPEYAGKTEVAIERTQHEIERLLARYGATGFMRAWKDRNEAVTFEMGGRRYRFQFATITKDDLDLTDSAGRPRNAGNLPGRSIQGAVEQANRARWRQLLLGIRAKLVMVESGIATMEEEFLANIVLPNQQTMGQWASPYLKGIYSTGQMPSLMPGAEQLSIEAPDEDPGAQQ